MSRLNFTAYATLALLAAAPAIAQDSMSNSSTSTSPSMSSDTSTCDQLMAKANGITSHSPAGLSMAHKEMTKAKEAKDTNDEASCQMHMNNAIKYLRS